MRRVRADDRDSLRLEVEDGGITLSAEIEKVEKFARSYRIVRKALDQRGALEGETLECRYRVVDADGVVRRASLGTLQDDGTFRIDLAQEDLPRGLYSVLVTLTLNGNTVDPEIRAIPYEVG